ncbi:MAG: transposase, partial [Kiritimatiellae bacterium]|nr:transposase [Kiritimatiellia bacterium]
LLMLGQLAHVFSLNELVDLSSIFSGELRRIRGIESVKLSTFSHANRTRSPSVGRRFFWFVYETFTRRDPAFARPRHKGVLAKFRMRGIYAIDSTTIQLAYWCIKWAKHRQCKAAVKVHMVANVANMLPMFAVVGKAKEHDSVREEEMFSSLGPGDVGVADRAYNNFRVLYRQTVRGVFFVVREKERTRHKVVSRVAKKALPDSIIADDATGTPTSLHTTSPTTNFASSKIATCPATTSCPYSSQSSSSLPSSSARHKRFRTNSMSPFTIIILSSESPCRVRY